MTTRAELDYQGERYPLLEVRAERAGSPRLLVLAGVHGNEHAGLLAIPPILERARAAPLPVDLTILTPVNPVGAAHLSRYDATFFFANRHVPRELATRLLVTLEDGGTRLAERDYFGRRLRPAGYAPTSPLGWAAWWVWARTLGMMASITYSDFRGVPEITLESSWRLADPASRVRAHVDLVLALAEALAVPG